MSNLRQLASAQNQARLSKLLEDLNTFNDEVRLVRDVFEDTARVFERLSTFPHRHHVSATAALNELDEASIRRVYQKNPALVVLGRVYLRGKAVNLIVGESILPPASGGGKPWRMVRVQSGKTRMLRTVYRDDDISGEYELADASTADFDAKARKAKREERHGKRPKSWLGEDDMACDQDSDCSDVFMEASLPSALLEKVKVTSCSSHLPGKANLAVDQAAKGILPFFVFCLDLNQPVTDEEEELLQYLRFAYPECPVLFAGCSTGDHSHVSQSPPNSHASTDSEHEVRQETTILNVEELLIRYGFFKPAERDKAASPTDRERKVSESEREKTTSPTEGADEMPAAAGFGSSSNADILFRPCHLFIQDIEELPAELPGFLSRNLNHWVLCAATLLRRSHVDCLTSFVHLAFEMSRDVLLTPKRIEYVRNQEGKLFSDLMALATLNQTELRKKVDALLVTLAPSLREEAADFTFRDLSIPDDEVVRSGNSLRRCTEQVKVFVMERLSSSVAAQLADSVDRMKESMLGTLRRCVQALEERALDESTASTTSSNHINGASTAIPQATTSTAKALQELLSSVYQLEFSERISQSAIRRLVERLRQTFNLVPWRTGVKVDAEWKRSIADSQIDHLSTSRLSKSICAQFRSKLVRAHQKFVMALQELENMHSLRLQEADEARVEVRKEFAPRVARLALHSTSLCDRITHGMPRVGLELGRGQYGVVYGCEPWAGHKPVCIKSVVPPDEKHWNDLSMEFHYMWNLPTHDRIVSLRGSVIDYTYGTGETPAVLLIMERMSRDLHAGIRQGLGWIERLQVSADVIEGIRYLHSQGLVHRDIKLKNVLLDADNRAKLTDLGFCKPEAMMTMSLVGTPIHMAPELFNGEYNSTVDVYAFGVLFWYICSNQTRLPIAYDRCQSKDQLWYEVRRGLRPERQRDFNDACWNLMTMCWHGESSQRPLPGIIFQKLTRFIEEAKDAQSGSKAIYLRRQNVKVR